MLPGSCQTKIRKLILLKNFHEIFGLTRIFHATETFICQAFRDTAVAFLPQVSDNAVNGRLRQHLQGENFSAKKSAKAFRYNYLLVNMLLI
jgi:hypothetical protein